MIAEWLLALQTHKITFKPNGQYISYMIVSQECNKNMLGNILYITSEVKWLCKYEIYNV